MNIQKIDNGYTVNYQLDNEQKEGNGWDNAYTNHTYAFTTWSDLIDFIGKNESLVND